MDATLAGTLGYQNLDGQSLVETLSGGKLYGESFVQDLKIGASTKWHVEKGTLGSASVVLIDEISQPVNLYINAAAVPFQLAATGSVLLFNVDVTKLEIETTTETHCRVVVLGD